MIVRPTSQLLLSDQLLLKEAAQISTARVCRDSRWFGVTARNGEDGNDNPSIFLSKEGNSPVTRKQTYSMKDCLGNLLNTMALLEEFCVGLS